MSAHYNKGAFRAGGRGRTTRAGMTARREKGALYLSTNALDAGKTPKDPTLVLGKQIRDALDPTKAPSKPKTFAEMTAAEQAEMRRLYERKP